MSNTLEDEFPLGLEVVVPWHGTSMRGWVKGHNSERKNRDGTLGAVLVRFGNSQAQTTTYFAPDQVVPLHAREK